MVSTSFSVPIGFAFPETEDWTIGYPTIQASAIRFLDPITDQGLGGTSAPCFRTGLLRVSTQCPRLVFAGVLLPSTFGLRGSSPFIAPWATLLRANQPHWRKGKTSSVDLWLLAKRVPTRSILGKISLSECGTVDPNRMPNRIHRAVRPPELDLSDPIGR